jgi:hypothetical protein
MIELQSQTTLSMAGRTTVSIKLYKEVLTDGSNVYSVVVCNEFGSTKFHCIDAHRADLLYESITQNIVDIDID